MTSDRRPAWAVLHTERAALADDLAQLTEEQWATASLCPGLSVREVLAHMTAGASLGAVRWFAGVVRNRFDFDKQVAMRLAEQLGATPAETLARFRGVVNSTTSPPLPRVAMLGEVIVHGEDIRRPLGLRHTYPIDAVTRIAHFYTGSDQMLTGKSRVRGLRLVATDGPFTVGAGPLVTGPTLAITMATTGRVEFCAELSGDGVATLRERSR